MNVKISCLVPIIVIIQERCCHGIQWMTVAIWKGKRYIVKHHVRWGRHGRFNVKIGKERKMTPQKNNMQVFKHTSGSVLRFSQITKTFSKTTITSTVCCFYTSLQYPFIDFFSFQFALNFIHYSQTTLYSFDSAGSIAFDKLGSSRRKMELGWIFFLFFPVRLGLTFFYNIYRISFQTFKFFLTTSKDI